MVELFHLFFIKHEDEGQQKKKYCLSEIKFIKTFLSSIIENFYFMPKHLVTIPFFKTFPMIVLSNSQFYNNLKMVQKVTSENIIQIFRIMNF